MWRRQRAGRLTWTRAHARRLRRQWGTVLFSDESKFNVSFSDGRLVSFTPEFQCYYFCESSCLFYLSLNSDFYVSKIMHL